MKHFSAFVSLLAATALAGTPALAATKGPPASTSPLLPPVATPVDQPLQHQTGMVVIEGAHGERTIIRSLEPRSLVGGDRLDFGLLDADGDGRVDRREAGIDRSLRSEFDNVDVDRDGTLDREELAGWIL
ncbi:hypothetical protein MNQ95_10390 [Pseudoxanthomonas daejeonensis]|uniref:hypothetical protein n=1 Tax=Pseudoxanthomonas daejeonensis TaxID=266062 RepID=UPI001F543AF0|nr:hypothetical protein [Pseudoxanthomonas daejeonensis]UNK56569.1 hypothetical protein MNQ95_10390 [Pseudoxanthomonas daejeonensis]